MWQDDALFDSMPPPGISAGATSIWRPPEPGLPFATVVNASWGPTNLTAVERSTNADPYEPVRVTLTASALVASRLNATPEGLVASTAEALLANATTLSPAQRFAVVESLLASRHEEGRGYQVFGEDMVPLVFIGYVVPLPDGLRLDALYAELAEDAMVGLGGFSSGPWAFGFSQASRSLQAAGGRLEVGPTGDARFQGFAEGRRSSDSYEKDLRAWLDEQGLPQPVTLDVQASVC